MKQPNKEVDDWNFYASFGMWVYQHEATIVEALKACMERYPVAQISRFEKALDAINRRERLTHTELDPT